MLKIEITIQPESLQTVTEALGRAKLGSFRVSEVTTFDPAAPPNGSYRGANYRVGRERMTLELIVQDHALEATIEAIRDAIDAFGEGDAELLVLHLEDSMRLSPSPWTRTRAIR